jgi:aspartyl-tRNA(Asn)/glutamyl-tRNA(Gln) amidotransferase subunit A
VNRLTLSALAAALAHGERTSRALVEECLSRIEDPKGEGQRTFVQVDREAALAQADAMDALRACGAAPSPYAGNPISIKDVFDIAGQVTRAASLALKDRPAATTDAPCIARLRQAGFVFIGRTNMTEFAYSGLGLNPHFGTPLNPWHRERKHIPGGSSSGAAISVVDGMSHGALGTDTGGSTRIPAAFNGLVGYKPTQRRVPRLGMIPLSPSLDSVGPIARSVGCCAVLDALLASEPPPDVHDISLAPLRFALPRTFVLDSMDDGVANDFHNAVSKIAASGAHIEEIEVPEFAEIPAINAKGNLVAAESYAWHRSILATLASSYDPRVLSRIQAGEKQSAADYIDLLSARAQFIANVNQRIADYDALILPTVVVPPPRMIDLKFDGSYYRTNALVLRNCAVINFLDGCAISVPMHRTGEAPTGLMLASRAGSDRRLFRCAAAVEHGLAFRGD